MKHSSLHRVLFLGCFALLLPGIPACSDAGSTPESSVTTGTLSLPLTTSAGGDTYRLNATLYLSGPVFQTLSTYDGDPGESTLSAAVQSGTYTAYLSQWGLEKLDTGTGQFTPVRATLASESATNLAVYDGTVTTLTYRFQVEDVVVTVGSGELRVKAEVELVDPVCTLMGAECPEGTWCPPSTLTGEAPRCVVEGPVAAGQPCGGALDCAGSSTCIDAGNGPRCTALCPPDSVGLPCDGGGTCQSAAVDYGLCLE